MQREEALELIKKHTTNQNLLKHMIAVEAIMVDLSDFFKEDRQTWALAGLLHDIDFEMTKDNHEKHGILACEILRNRVSQEVLDIIKSHNEKTGFKAESRAQKSLIAADAVSGLIIAAALIMPSKKLKDVKPESLKEKFKKKDFARAVSREHMMICEELGLPLDKFLELSLNALQKVSDQLGL
jgi:putative nucleotidyltransferase with HDIG domain